MTINFKWTANEDYSIPDNNYDAEIQSIEVGDDYTFDDYLSDNGVDFEEENGTYYVTEFGERTGEAYMVL